MITVGIVKAPDFSAFGKALSEKKKGFYEDAMKLIVADIVGGIKAQTDITGHSFPALEPETIRRKGHDHAMIDKGLLSDEWTYQMLNQWRKDTGEITIKPLSKTIRTKTGSRKDTPRDQVAGYLQIDGIETKSGRKHFRFFGVSAKAAEEVSALIAEIIKSSLEAI